MRMQIAGAGLTSWAGNTAAAVRRGMRGTVGLALAVWLGTAGVTTQTDPRTLPLVQPGDLVSAGAPLPVPGSDNGQALYGGVVLAPDDAGGLWYSCNGPGQLARITLGAAVTVTQPCQTVPGLPAFAPGGDVVLAGVLAAPGRLVVSATTFYDTAGLQKFTHAAGASLAALSAPVRVGTAPPGMVGGWMTDIPAEWRGLFGGAALTGQCCLTIISRTSYGPAATVFDPADLTRPAVQVLGYPDAHQTLGPWSGASGNNQYRWGANTSIGGMHWIPGTRTVLFIGSAGLGPYCYGDPGVGTCAGISDTVYPYHGPHSPPYTGVVWFYDANDLLAVKNGTLQPWDVRPYAVRDLDLGGSIAQGSALLGDTLVIARKRWPQGTDLLRYRVAAAPPPPPDPCAVNPLVVTSPAWPGGTEGRRSGTFTWSVANLIVTLQSATWEWSPQRLIVTDSRGCTVTVTR